MACYSKDHKMIAVEYQDILGGKRPGLYIGTPTELLKVATFGSPEKAKKFEEWLTFFFGRNLVKEGDRDA